MEAGDSGSSALGLVKLGNTLLDKAAFGVEQPQAVMENGQINLVGNLLQSCQRLTEPSLGMSDLD